MAAPTLTATTALHLDIGGASGYDKDPDVPTIPASTLKVMTFTAARTLITDAMLYDTVTFTEADQQSGSTANLQVGDVLTWRDLFYGMMLPSGNDAARCICRTLGQHLIDTGQSTATTPLSAFYGYMRDMADGWGWTGYAFVDGWGLSNSNRMTARQLAQLLLDADPFMILVMGSRSHTMTSTGTTPRTWTVNHTIDPDGEVKLPEFVAGKTGTTAVANVGILWDHGGTRHATVVMGGTSSTRFYDLRAVMDYVIGDDPRSGLFRTSGDPVALALTNGAPVVLT